MMFVIQKCVIIYTSYSCFMSGVRIFRMWFTFLCHLEFSFAKYFLIMRKLPLFFFLFICLIKYLIIITARYLCCFSSLISFYFWGDRNHLIKHFHKRLWQFIGSYRIVSCIWVGQKVIINRKIENVFLDTAEFTKVYHFR